jgi:hypothetical protein
MKIKEIFLAWEKLRILYITLLLAVLVERLVAAYWFNESGPPEVRVANLIFQIFECAVVANILYLAGPIFEGYIKWLGATAKYWRAVLFSAGLIVSIALEIGVLALMLTPF